MTRWLLRTIFAVLLASPAYAAGTLPIVLQQQFAFTGCATTPTTAACGQPLAGGLLYFYQVGTVATRQDSFQDTGLTIANAWPLQLDQNGRVPPFYLADGSIHIRLTDSGGVVQFDYPAMLVIGPSSGGGGGGSVDPTTVAATGDVKYRPGGDVLSGWVKLNGLTIGSAVSGATQRANADTQSLFVYLWTTFPDAICTVSGGRGGSALADFNANKTIKLIDYRASIAMGLDDMGNSPSGSIGSPIAINTPGGSATTAGTSVGRNIPTLTTAMLPTLAFTFGGTPVTPTFTGNAPGNAALNSTNVVIASTTAGFSGSPVVNAVGGGSLTFPSLSVAGGGSFILASPPNTTIPTPTGSISQITPAGNISINGGGNTITNTSGYSSVPFAVLGTWYMKL